MGSALLGTSYNATAIELAGPRQVNVRGVEASDGTILDVQAAEASDATSGRTVATVAIVGGEGTAPLPDLSSYLRVPGLGAGVAWVSGPPEQPIQINVLATLQRPTDANGGAALGSGQLVSLAQLEEDVTILDVQLAPNDSYLADGTHGRIFQVFTRAPGGSPVLLASGRMDTGHPNTIGFNVAGLPIALVPAVTLPLELAAGSELLFTETACPGGDVADLVGYSILVTVHLGG